MPGIKSVQQPRQLRRGLFVDHMAGAGKHAAMARLSERLDIPFSRFFAAGDGMTDLEMMHLSGVSYAPENALDPVRRAASRVVPPVEEGGMEAAFRHAANLICEVS